MVPQVRIADVAIWIKHIESPELKSRLQSMADNEAIQLEADGVIGRWSKMKTGRDGRPTDAIRPEGTMKEVWSKWYRHRRGEVIGVREVKLSEDYLANIASLFPEWESEEDEDAFRDL